MPLRGPWADRVCKKRLQLTQEEAALTASLVMHVDGALRTRRERERVQPQANQHAQKSWHTGITLKGQCAFSPLTITCDKCFDGSGQTRS